MVSISIISCLIDSLLVLMALIMVLYYLNYIFNKEVFSTIPFIASLYINPIAVNNHLTMVTMHFLLSLYLKLVNLDHGKIYTCRLSHTYLIDNICTEFCSL